MSGVIGVSPNMNTGVFGKYPVGHVIQIVNGIYSTEKITTSSSFATINSALEPSITVTGSNKVFVMCSVPVYSTSDGHGLVIQIFRGSTALGDTNWGFGLKVTSAGAGNGAAMAASVLDTPGAGTHTYKLQHRQTSSSGYSCINSSTATITLMEISA